MLRYQKNAMLEYPINKRRDGKYEQRLGDEWFIEYWEDPRSDLWRAEVFHKYVAKWVSKGHLSMEEAGRAVRNYLDQL